MEARITVRRMKEMSSEQLYEILKLRQDIFQVEENIVYPDLDNIDLDALHVMAVIDEEGRQRVVSYVRVYFELTEKLIKIGRVATLKKYRNKGLSAQLIKVALEEAQRQFHAKEVWLDSQMHVIHYYESIGFQKMTDPFIEAGIQHVKMKYVI